MEIDKKRIDGIIIKLSITEAEALQMDFKKSLKYNYWDYETSKNFAKRLNDAILGDKE